MGIGTNSTWGEAKDLHDQFPGSAGSGGKHSISHQSAGEEPLRFKARQTGVGGLVKSLNSWLRLVFMGADQESKARYIEEWSAILSEPRLTPQELRALWREAVAMSFVLTARRFARNWKTISAVALVALVVAPIWLVMLLPLFLIPRSKVE